MDIFNKLDTLARETVLDNEKLEFLVDLFNTMYPDMDLTAESLMEFMQSGEEHLLRTTKIYLMLEHSAKLKVENAQLQASNVVLDKLINAISTPQTNHEEEDEQNQLPTP